MKIVFVIALLSLSLGCVDEPHCLVPMGSATPATHLTSLGLFQGNIADLKPSADLVPYDVNVSLYSDEAQKARFIRLPSAMRVHSTDDRFEPPVGTWLIKTFFYPTDARDPSLGRTLIETRIMAVTANGLTASTYVWNRAQTDAECSGGNVDVPTSWTDERGVLRQDHFHVPGTTQCMSCHDNHLLGWRTRQLNQNDQLARLTIAGVLDGQPKTLSALVDPQGSAPLAERARSYLDANCGHCHNSESSADASGTQVYLDYDHDLTHLFCRSTDDVNGSDHVIVPGHSERSEIFARMRSNDPFLRMPRGPTHIPDGAGMRVLTDWVSSLPEGCP